MMWQTGEPSERGYYLCAWQKMGGGFTYDVVLWTGTYWKTGMMTTPHTWKVIESPKAQNEMLDNLYEYAQ